MEHTKHVFRVITASVIGNALEFYNLTLYAALTSIFAALYFPSENHSISLLASLATFGIAFLVRPLGAIIFGHIGDKIGRKQALSLSIIIMGIPTVAITFLPVYSQIGLWAPVLLIACRFVQGLCAGGEFNGATIFAIEHLGGKKPGLIGGTIVGSCLLGSLTASLVVSLLTSSFLPSWAWRIAFLIGGVFSLCGLYLRKKIDESPVFKELKKQDKLIISPLKTALSVHWRSCLIICAIAAFDGSLTYTLVTFLNVYHVNYVGFSLSDATFYGFFGMLSCMISCPIFGYYADKFGARETLVVGSLIILGLAIPTFMALSAETWFAILGGYVLLGSLVAAIIGVQPLFSQELFPPQDRYTGISFSYSMGVGIFGGLTPALLTFFMNHYDSPLIPSLYLMALSIIFLGVLLLLPARK